MKDLATQYHYDDFTEAHYGDLIRLAKRHYVFQPFGTQMTESHVLWRHDIDFSPHRALKLAQIEVEHEVHSTFFVLLHSEFYNVLEKPVFEVLREIFALGHSLGLHFDMGFYPKLSTQEELAQKLVFEKNILESLFEKPVTAFSFHNPDTNQSLDFGQAEIAGMVNAYGEILKSRYSYCSDSNGYWRYQRLYDVLEKAESSRLHVLTHPCWWVPTPMSPRERVSRSIDGRSERLHQAYDSFLSQFGRENIGK
jgi:peptidoglycan/xylan/chitin deacetylase (PgdA/CDA1 family)